MNSEPGRTLGLQDKLRKSGTDVDFGLLLDPAKTHCKNLVTGNIEASVTMKISETRDLFFYGQCTPMQLNIYGVQCKVEITSRKDNLLKEL